MQKQETKEQDPEAENQGIIPEYLVESFLNMKKSDEKHRDLVLIIDMQNAYKEGMPWACMNLERTEANIIRLLDAGKDAVFTEFLAPENPAGAWREYNTVNEAINSDGYANALMDEFIPYAQSHRVFSKSAYSAFSNDELRQLAEKYERIVIAGVVAECCVLSTAFSCIDEGMPFIYMKDAVSGISDEAEAQAEAILSYLTPVHGLIMTTDEYLNA